MPSHLDLLRDKLEGNIASRPSELAEQYQQQILWSSGVVAFVVGIALGSLRALVGVLALGFVLALAVTAPAYAAYTQNPVRWLATLDDDGLAQPAKVQ
ncbi:hypothetical protein JCM11491_003299 [Sporobolomyces phaffii]